MTFRTLLAGTPKSISDIRLPVFASPKLDGIRFHIINGEVLSRNLLPFKNKHIQKLFGRSAYNGLDGEFMYGDPTDPKAFRKAAVVNSINGDISEVVGHVFDCFRNPNERFDDRLRHATVVTGVAPWFQIVPHTLVHTTEELEELEAKFLAEGYEGMMTRKPDGTYKYGRSTASEGILLKVKQFLDGEAIVVGYEERMHNANEKTLMRAGKASRNTRKDGLVGRGDLGALTVRDRKTGVEFSVGSGFTDVERVVLWETRDLLKGQIVKYRYFPTGGKDKPRFPTFVGFRDPGDM